MEVSYNLKYKKSNFSNKVILDKEGEVIIYTKGFRLKGKGASDKGELINFSEIKEFYHKPDRIHFVTFTKEKYVLSEAGTLFDQLLIDMYKSRNEFLMDALFMKGGKLKAEYEGHFTRVSKFARPISKDKAKFRLHESSLIVLPAQQDAFVVHFDFVNFYEFDDIEYQLKIVMDNGENIFISQLGNDFEFFQEKFEGILGGMYQTVVNDVLRKAFPHFHSATLLKLAYRMKGGKAVSLRDIEKMDKEMAEEVENFIYEDDVFKEKTSVLREIVDSYNTYYGISQDKTVDGGFIKWVMFAVPEKNIVAFSILPRWRQSGEDQEKIRFNHGTYFYKIIMEKGSPADKVEDKLNEINEALVNLRFVKDPCFKDKRELKHSPYQYAIRKLPYLRILRKSYIGKVSATEVKDWQKQVQTVMKKAELK